MSRFKVKFFFQYILSLWVRKFKHLLWEKFNEKNYLFCLKCYTPCFHFLLQYKLNLRIINDDRINTRFSTRSWSSLYRSVSGQIILICFEKLKQKRLRDSSNVSWFNQKVWWKNCSLISKCIYNSDVYIWLLNDDFFIN